MSSVRWCRSGHLRSTFPLRLCVLHSGSTNASLQHHVTPTRGKSVKSTVAADPLPLSSRLQMTSWEGASEIRDLLVRRLCSSTQPLPLMHVYNEIANRPRILEDLHSLRTTRRVAHQREALRFLRRYNVLLHSLLFYVPSTQTWNTTVEFKRLAMLGESVLVTELRARVLKLFPDMPYSTYVLWQQQLVGEEAFASAFDLFHMESIVGSRPGDAPFNAAATHKKKGQSTRAPSPQTCAYGLSAAQRSHMMCAVVGEMYWFMARTKATDRTHNNALFPPSDVLILHVLCSHLLESMPAELVYRWLDPLLRSIKEKWINAPMSLPSQWRHVPHTLRVLSLNRVPTAPSVTPPVAGTGNTNPMRDARRTLHPLSSTLDHNGVKSTMRPRCHHTNFNATSYQGIPLNDKRKRATLHSTRTPRVEADVSLDPALWNAKRVQELANMASYCSGNGC